MPAEQQDSGRHDTGQQDVGQEGRVEPAVTVEHMNDDGDRTFQHDVAGARQDDGAATVQQELTPAPRRADGTAPLPAVAGGATRLDPDAVRAQRLDPDAERRAARREEAFDAPAAGRVLQVVLAVCVPFLLIIGALRALTTPLFLWIEYHRPGFPADTFGFTTDDRMTYGSYSVDYLLNWSGARYLGDLVAGNGQALFLPSEVSHMHDVKAVLSWTFIAGTALLILAVICVIYLGRRYKGGIRRGLFAGAVATIVLMIAIAVLALTGWESFFTGLHEVFFANGTWTFRVSDTLIRLFPEQFWMDSGIAVAGLVLVTAILILIFGWPTRARRHRSADAQARVRRRMSDEPRHLDYRHL